MIATLFQVIIYFPVFLYYFITDLFRNRGVHRYPYGVWLYVGLPGTGKTISVVEYLQRVKKKFPDIKIYTNFGYEKEDKPILGWRDLIDYPGPAVFVLDEVQLTFSSRDWAKFPIEVLTLLTQNRKVRKQIIGTAQSYHRVDKIFRELCNFIIECKCLAGRWVFQKAFHSDMYELHEDPRRGKPRYRAWRYNFIQMESHRDKFDTLKRLEALKEKEYIERVKEEVV